MTRYLDNPSEVLPYTVREGRHREEDVLHVARALAPDVLPPDAEVVLSKVSGGITNELYQVRESPLAATSRFFPPDLSSQLEALWAGHFTLLQVTQRQSFFALIANSIHLAW
jgi:hypothetical protein